MKHNYVCIVWLVLRTSVLHADMYVVMRAVGLSACMYNYIHKL